MKQYDIIAVGSGAAGALAYELTKRENRASVLMLIGRAFRKARGKWV